jgi:hypothetical protein
MHPIFELLCSQYLFVDRGNPEQPVSIWLVAGLSKNEQFLAGGGRESVVLLHIKA